MDQKTREATTKKNEERKAKQSREGRVEFILTETDAHASYGMHTEICICYSSMATARKDKTEMHRIAEAKPLNSEYFVNSYGFIKYVYNGIRDNKDQYVQCACSVHTMQSVYRTLANAAMRKKQQKNNDEAEREKEGERETERYEQKKPETNMWMNSKKNNGNAKNSQPASQPMSNRKVD